MNIFLLDLDQKKCAQYHNDKHVNKMLTESTQILSTCLQYYGFEAPYRKTHVNHPCCKWVRQSLLNYQWLWKLTDELGKEYTYRYGKFHLAHQKLLNQISFTPEIDFPSKKFTLPPNCTSHKEIKDTIEAYREYYRTDKVYFCKWTKRGIPYWFNK